MLSTETLVAIGPAVLIEDQDAEPLEPGETGKPVTQDPDRVTPWAWGEALVMSRLSVLCARDPDEEDEEEEDVDYFSDDDEDDDDLDDDEELEDDFEEEDDDDDDLDDDDF